VPTISRRSFLAAAGTLPFWVWFERHAAAQATHTRPDAWTSEGQAMLKIYANAAHKMMHTIAEGDPASWLFQWYTHSVGYDRQTQTADAVKAAELQRVYPSGGPQHDLAEEMWNTCRAHFHRIDQPFFLPWHRMYVYFFERIVRKVSGEPSFALPYWDYSAPDATKHGIIPPEFRKSSDPVFKALYRANRNRPTPGFPNPNVNNGEPIDKFKAGDLALTALKQGAYLPAFPLEGFNLAIDGHLHGNVHVDTGDRTNMGDVPWAARDPIFWLHHCNIDRLWTSWNKSGGLNPTGTWLTQEFVFADENGQRVSAKVDDFKDVGILKYDYDRLEGAPPVFKVFTGNLTDITGRSAVAYSLKTPVALGPRPVRAVLQPLAAAQGKTFTSHAATLIAAHRVYLVIRGRQTNAAPGVSYNVYLNPPDDIVTSAPSPHFAGRVNFFDAGHGAPDGTPAGPSDDFISFDVTEVIRDLMAKGGLSETPTVAIVPVGSPASYAKPQIGEISIVQL
jgi:tyrosinase